MTGEQPRTAPARRLDGHSGLGKWPGPCPPILFLFLEGMPWRCGGDPGLAVVREALGRSAVCTLGFVIFAPDSDSLSS